MSQTPGESRIPILHHSLLKSRLSKPLSNFSSKVRAHLDCAKSRSSTPSPSFFTTVSFTAASTENTNTDKQNITSRRSDLKHNPLRPTNIFPTGYSLPSGNGSAECKVENYEITAEHVGCRVKLTDGKEGVLRYFGKAQFNDGIWCGIELDSEDGLNDGSVDNVRYFKCASKKGVFCSVEEVIPLSEEIKDYISDISDSGPHSLLGITGELSDVTEEETTQVCRAKDTKDNVFRYSGSHLRSASQVSTPTPNSSSINGFVPPWEWKNSQRSSSAGSLALSCRGTSSMLDPLSTSVHMSKHSSFECEDSLGILTPDQMAEFTANCSNEGSVKEGYSCEDLSGFNLTETRLENIDETNDLETRDSSGENVLYDTVIEVQKPLEITVDSELPLEEVDIMVKSEPFADLISSETDTCLISSTSDAVLSGQNVTSSLDDIVPAIECSKGEYIPPQSVTVSAATIVTSASSIASWDNGYQGDGECSRPTSRGAFDTSPGHIPSLKLKPTETATDSDFFTESDPDVYEELSSCLNNAGGVGGNRGGDRNACVIDGKLYGSLKCSDTQAIQEEPDNMDSSGVYSDIEKKVEEPEPKMSFHHEGTASEIFGNSSNKSVISSGKLESVPTNPPQINSQTRPHSPVDLPIPIIDPELVVEAVHNIINAKSTSENKETKRKSDMPSSRDTSNSRNNKKLRSSPINAFETKHRQPRRTIPNSKSKEPTSGPLNKASEDENNENVKPARVHRYTKKGPGRWDTIMSKIEKSRAEERLKPCKYRDVKSKVTTGVIKDQSAGHLIRDTRPLAAMQNVVGNSMADKSEHCRALTGSTRSLKDLLSYNRIRSARKLRVRGGFRSPASSSVATAPASLSQGSSIHSSASDISDSNIFDISHHSLPASTAISVSSSSSLVTTTTTRSSTKKKVKSAPTPVVTSAVSDVPPPRSSAVRPVTGSPSNTLSRTKTFAKPSVPAVGVSGVDSCISTTKTQQNNKKLLVRGCTSKVVCPKDQNRIVKEHSQTRFTTKPQELLPAPVPINTEKHARPKSIRQPPPEEDASKTISLLRQQLIHANKGIEAFAILIQHLTEDPDIYKLSQLKDCIETNNQKIQKLSEELGSRNNECAKLKADFSKQKASYGQQLQNLKDTHAHELLLLEYKHREEINRCDKYYRERLESVEEAFRNKELHLFVELRNELKTVEQKAENKLESILNDAVRVIDEVKKENSLYKQYTDRCFQEQLYQLKSQYEERERDFSSKLEILKNELLEKEDQFELLFLEKQIRLERISKESLNTGVDATSTSSNHVDRDDEICSLRTVLDLKQSEIQDLRRQNENLQREVEELPVVTRNLESSLARIEDLEAQLKAKTGLEKELSKENKRLIELVHQETEKKKRLEFQNEELQWKLKKSTQVAKTLAAISTTKHQDEASISPGKMSPESSDAKEHTMPFVDKNSKFLESPIDTPQKVLGVVEKADSVSWVLEIDEPPIEVASRMLRRANSLRGETRKKQVQSTFDTRTLPSRIKKRKQTIVHSSTLTNLSTQDRTFNFGVPNGEEESNFSESRYCRYRTFSSECELRTKDNRSNESPDISTFFDFLPDSDADDVMTDRSGMKENFGQSSLQYSTSSSNSDSSLGLEQYDTSNNSCEKGLQSVERVTDDEIIGQTTDEETNLLSPSTSSSVPKMAAGEAMVSKETSETEITSDSSGHDVDELLYKCVNFSENKDKSK